MRGAGWLLVLLTAVFRYMMCGGRGGRVVTCSSDCHAVFRYMMCEGGRVVTCSSDCCVQVHDV